MNRWERNKNGRLERCPSREELLYQEGIARAQLRYIRELFVEHHNGLSSNDLTYLLTNEKKWRQRLNELIKKLY